METMDTVGSLVLAADLNEAAWFIAGELSIREEDQRILMGRAAEAIVALVHHGAQLHAKLESLERRIVGASRELETMAERQPDTSERLRLAHKAQGVRLALSYLQDETRP